MVTGLVCRPSFVRLPSLPASLLPARTTDAPSLPPCGVLVATNARNCLARTNSLFRHSQFTHGEREGGRVERAGPEEKRRGERTEQKRRDGWNRSNFAIVISAAMDGRERRGAEDEVSDEGKPL